MSVAEAAKGTQLSVLKKHPKGEMYQVAFISKALNELKTLVKCEANADQLVIWAELIAARYWYFKAEELLKVLLEGASGKYGKTYGAVNFQTLCEWLDGYEEEKRKYNEDQALKYKENYDHNRGTITLKDLHEQNKLNALNRQAKK
jgi:hypothetical protein